METFFCANKRISEFLPFRCFLSEFFTFVRLFAFLCFCLVMFLCFWSFFVLLVPCILFVLFVRIKSYHKKKKKFKAALLTSFILLLLLRIVITSQCLKSVQIRRYFCFVFSCIRTEYGEIRSITKIQENTYQK